MRSIPLIVGLVLGLGLGACSTEPAAGPTDDQPTTVSPISDSPEAILAILHSGLLDSAFRTLDSLGYSAGVDILSLGPDGKTVGTYTMAIVAPPDGDAAVQSGTGTGSLADTTGVAPDRFTQTDPLATVLPDPPPYLDPASRDLFAVRMLPGPGRGAEAVADPSAKKVAVRRAAISLDSTGRFPASLEVLRETASPVYSETTTVSVHLSTVDGVRVPTQIVTDTQIKTLLGQPRHLRVTWTVRAAGGTALGAENL